ncbi:hypothetical protein DZ860_00850 [Vibrio sinensis]|uniref:Hyaluronate lyase n=1 Tax=Vibrio sinensis TaxID=2302434 RepID=A0A3A6QR76_9VIBR|nr:polysaccharide lyase 8 family protein [Vibrio sinensis]RJX75265.1 hypothetical protein DZ860_00850 [Vibrio sinensis]
MYSKKLFKTSLIATSIALSIASTTAIATELVQQVEVKQSVNEINSIREKWASYFLGDVNQPITENMKTQIIEINTQAKELLNTMTLDKNGLWEELPLHKDSAAEKQKLGVNLYATYNNIFTLARAYKLQGGELYHDSDVREAITESLVLLNEHHYHVGTPEYGNWWHWELGISRTAQNTLVVMYNDIPYEIVNNYVDASRYFVPVPTHLSVGYGAPYSSAPLAWESTGGNRTDNAQVVLVRGLLENNKDEIKSAIAALPSVIPYVESGDGFYSDGSYIQHKDLPYSGTYGQVMLEGLGMLLGAVANTEYQATDPELQKIYPLMLETFAPLLIDGRMSDMVNGRAISRMTGQNDEIGESVLSAMLLYVDGAPLEYKEQLTSFLKHHFDAKGGLEKTRLINNHQIADRMMMTREVKEQSTVSHKQFPNMDRVIHHRDDWSFGIAMHSDRVGNYESINGENLKGWHTADGMTYLYNQQKHYSNGYWVAGDAFKHAGTTVLLTERENATGQLSAQRNGRNGAMDWTGGASLGDYGVAGMKFVNFNSDLSANKSWFMFDNEIVALGSDIKNSSSDQAITTVENRQVEQAASLMVDGLTVEKFNGNPKSFEITYNTDAPVNEHSTIQYSILDDSVVDIQKQCRSGDWSDIGTSQGSVTACFYEAVINHDDNDSYAYMVTPNRTEISDSVTIVKNSNGVHAVEHKELGIFAANFFEDGKAGFITADDQMSIMTQEKDGLLYVAVSNPTRSWFDIDFTVDGSIELVEDSDKRVELNDNKLSIDMNGLAGSSYKFVIKRK